LLDVNFNADKNGWLGTVKTGFAAIGQSTSDYWNVCSRSGATDAQWLSYVTVSNLSTVDGTPTGAGLSLSNAPGAWGNNVGDAMYNSYLYPFNGGNITVIVTNLPVGSYDFYIYGHGSTDQGGMQNLNGVYQLSSGGVDYGTQTTATNGLAWNTTNWQEGQQYVVFRDVTLSSATQSVLLTGLPGAGGEALIAGMQIVQQSATKESLASAYAAEPAMQITPTARPVLSLVQNAAGRFCVSFIGQIGSGYRIEYADTISGSWIPLTTGTLSQATCKFEDASSAGASQRFYRVVMLP
jgi:hypothetical protein